MTILVNLLVWAHILAFAVGTAGGLGMAQVGPRLIAAAPDQRETWWPMAKVFNKLTAFALLALLVTGPLMLWLKYAGGAGLGPWFMLKMTLVVAAIVAIGVNKIGFARFKRGDESGARLMMISGQVTTLIMLVLVLAAVFAFG